MIFGACKCCSLVVFVFVLLCLPSVLCTNVKGRATKYHQSQSNFKGARSSAATMDHNSMDRRRRKQDKKQDRSIVLARIAKRMKMLAELNNNTKLQLETNIHKYPSSVLKSVSSSLFFESFEGKMAIPMTGSEGNNSRRCTFLAAECEMEVIEHSLVNKFFQPDDRVLELGARFGTTSCAIAAKQINSGNLVVVEPDFNVWYLLEANRKTHLCNFWTFRGVISQQSMMVREASYATRAIPQDAQLNIAHTNLSAIKIDNLSLGDLQQQTGITFTAILLDCEGCIDAVFGKHIDIEDLRKALKGVRTIILEGDMSDRDPMCSSFCVDYNAWKIKLVNVGFKIVYEEQDRKFHSIVHYVFQRQQ